MTAATKKARRFRRAGAGVAACVLVAASGGLALAGAAPLRSGVGASATGEQASTLISVSPIRVLDTRASSGGPIGVTTAAPSGRARRSTSSSRRRDPCLSMGWGPC